MEEHILEYVTGLEEEIASLKEKLAISSDEKNDYGKEIIMDLHDCNPNRFTREIIKEYFEEVCYLIDMERCKLCWWESTPEEERQAEPHLVGTSAVQFIVTSNITIHTLKILKSVYLNLFSCKLFDEREVFQCTKQWFEGMIVNQKVIRRI